MIEPILEGPGQALDKPGEAPDKPGQVRYPEPIVYGSTYLFDASGYKATIERVSEHGRTIYGELSIWLEPASGPKVFLYGPASFGLNGSKPGGDATRELTAVTQRYGLEAYDWQQIISYLCRKVVAKYREGGPIVYIGNLDSPGVQWLYAPFLLKNQINLLYGKGEAGKSLFTRWVACKLRLAMEANPLILDWETDADSENERVRALGKGLEGEGVDIAYRHMDGKFTEQIDSIATQVAREGITLVIVDSLGRSISADTNKEEGILQTYNAISSLGVTSWFIDHTNREDELYGNIYKSHQARCVWHLKAMKEPGDIDFSILAINDKNNNRPKSAPIGFHVKVEANDEKLRSVRFSRSDLLSQGFFEDEFSMSDRIKAALRSNGGKLSRESLREEVLGERPAYKDNDTYRQALSRLRKSAVILEFPDKSIGLKSDREQGL